MNDSADQQPHARSSHWLIALQLLGAVALAFSSATAVDYYARSHAFCSAKSGCGVVRASQLGQSIGDALPAIGIGGFVLLLLLTSSRSPRARLLGLSLAVAGGIAGLVLLGLQAFVIGAWCALCIGSDVPALLAGVCALVLLRAPAHVPPPTVRTRAFSHALLVLALFVPPILAFTRPPHVPAYVRTLSAAGKINVIEFSDFECPFCRGLHPVLKAALAPYGDRVHFARKSFPLPGHRDARHADRAYLCASAQGQGEAMADWLFSAPDIGVKRSAKHAAALGLDSERFEACTHDAATERTIKKEMAAIRRDGFHGLPTVWIGTTVIEGFDKNLGAAPYTAALTRAEQSAAVPNRFLPWALLLLVTCAVLLPVLRRS